MVQRHLLKYVRLSLSESKRKLSSSLPITYDNDLGVRSDGSVYLIAIEAIPRFTMKLSTVFIALIISSTGAFNPVSKPLNRVSCFLELRLRVLNPLDSRIHHNTSNDVVSGRNGLL
jgi:hypothetical protein